MDILSTDEIHKLIENSHQQYRALLKEMSPRLLTSWDWASKDFTAGAKWIREHPHEIRTGIYLSDTPNKEVWRITVPETQDGYEVVVKYYYEPSPSWFALGQRSVAVNETLNYAMLEALREKE